MSETQPYYKAPIVPEANLNFHPRFFIFQGSSQGRIRVAFILNATLSKPFIFLYSSLFRVGKDKKIV